MAWLKDRVDELRTHDKHSNSGATNEQRGSKVVVPGTASPVNASQVLELLP